MFTSNKNRFPFTDIGSGADSEMQNDPYEFNSISKTFCFLPFRSTYEAFLGVVIFFAAGAGFEWALADLSATWRFGFVSFFTSS